MYLKDLVASRLVVQRHWRTALAPRIRLAVLDLINLGLIQQRPAVAGMPGLGPVLILLCHNRSLVPALPQQGHCPNLAMSSKLRR